MQIQIEYARRTGNLSVFRLYEVNGERGEKLVVSFFFFFPSGRRIVASRITNVPRIKYYFSLGCLI